MRDCIKKTRQRVLIYLVSVILLFGVAIVGNSTISVASSNPYLIKVNKLQNIITIYKMDSKGKYTIPVKAMICSTGKATPIGTFQLLGKYKWKLMIEDVWSQYATRITGDILFHSVWYYEQDPSTLSARQYNKLGTSASHGCIRLTVADAKWLQTNCSSGTTVKIYNSKKEEPIKKPIALILKAYTGWDPTDVTNEDNPFNKIKPKITGAKNKTIAYGTTVNLKKGIKAYSTAGTEITSSLKITGKVKNTIAGKYKIKYKITDAMGRKKTKTITYTVKEDVRKPVFKGVKMTVLPANTVVTEALVLSKVSAKVGKTNIDKALIKVTITLTEDSTSRKSYSVVYTVTAPTSKKTTTKKTTFIVDKLAPSITGIRDRYATQTQMNALIGDAAQLRAFALEGITCSENITVVTNNDIQIALTANANGTYAITYTLKDQSGNVTKMACNLTPLVGPTLVAITPSIDIALNQVLTPEETLNNVRFVANSGQDYTAAFKSLIVVTLVKEADRYTANYSLTIGGEIFTAIAIYPIK